jgi:hypothetical protein
MESRKKNDEGSGASARSVFFGFFYKLMHIGTGEFRRAIG